MRDITHCSPENLRVHSLTLGVKFTLQSHVKVGKNSKGAPGGAVCSDIVES